MIVAGGLRGIRKRDLVPGIVTGALLFAGYAFQTVGLQYTSASNAGFITGMFVVFTPLFVALLHRRLPPAASMLGVAFAVLGLYLVTDPEGVRVGYGDALEVGCAASFAAHIMALHRYARAMPTFRFTTIQMLVVAIVSGAWTVTGERGPAATFDARTWMAIGFTAVFASALAFWVQARAQRIVPPTRTAIILTSEPVFAGIFGALAGERIGVTGWLGAAAILAGILVAELRAGAAQEFADQVAPT